MDTIGVFERFLAMRWLNVCFVGSVLAVAAGCAAPEMRSGQQAAEAAEPIPVQVPMTPDQERERADAKRAYVSCLKQAAQYMKTQGGASGDEANLVAPLCYAQFSRYEEASTAAMSTRDRRTFDRAGDKRQVDFAADAIRQQNGLAALTTANQ
jgi:hypothetical protein